MSSSYHASILSQSTYFDSDLIKSNNGYEKLKNEGWTYLRSTNEMRLSKDGYFGVAFQDRNEIIEYKGLNLHGKGFFEWLSTYLNLELIDLEIL